MKDDSVLPYNRLAFKLITVHGRCKREGESFSYLDKKSSLYILSPTDEAVTLNVAIWIQLRILYI